MASRRGGVLVFIAALQAFHAENLDPDHSDFDHLNGADAFGEFGDAERSISDEMRQGARGRSVEMTFKYSYTNTTLFNYAAESRGYPEEPDRVFVTCRGGGMTVIDLSTPGSNPPDVVARWETPWTVEGQDRMGELLVVSELGRGPAGPLPRGPHLHLFRLPRDGAYGPALSPFGSVNLTSHIDAILHVKLYQNDGGETWAICSGGFATTAEGALVAVNLTRVLLDWGNSSEGSESLGDFRGGHDVRARSAAIAVSVLETDVSQPEGVMIVGDYAYIGGINSSTLAVVALDDPSPMHMHVVAHRDHYGAQLVATSWAKEPFGSGPPDLLYMADWREVGGLAIVNTSDPTMPVLLSSVRSQQAAKANRVKMFQLRLGPWLPHQGDPEVMNLALLPLEQPIGALAVVDVTNATEARLVAVQRLPLFPTASHNKDGRDRNRNSWTKTKSRSSKDDDDAPWTSTKTYCLAVSQSAEVHVFVALTSTVYVFQLSAADAAAANTNQQA
uniref:Methanethiol oxidase n=1 Tax=Lotharella oceanica TaxID=641309 RepID=A0A7S2TM36_9EUKA|mmetsp:Transcript_19998/g.37565  ORF Transcript_19998/g.37565 Transcript_19998/m.37565 type:complete len:502 (+) Transcript_19998:27-1532(+)